MKLEDLKPGRRYKLTRDVENPLVDRRERYDAGKLAWSADDVFRAEFSVDGTLWSLDAIHIEATPRSPNGRIYPSHEGFPALVDALEELPERTRDVCARLFVNADDIVDRLVDTGILTMEQINRVAEYLKAEDDAEDAAKKASEQIRNALKDANP